MSAIGALATGAVKAMFTVYDRKYGKGAKQIRRLKKDLIKAEKVIARLRENVSILVGDIASRDSKIEALQDEIDHWSGKYFELVEIAKQPVELDDNPYEESEDDDKE